MPPGDAALLLSPACPDDGELLLFFDGRIPETRRDDIEAHLDTCASCRRVLGAVVGGSATVDADLDRVVPRERAMPAKIGELEIVRRLGHGGMGEVWLARDTLLERDVAIKLGRGAMTEEARARFVVEARAVARLRHPNILAVHHVGELGDRAFLVTELLHGRSLDALGQLPPAEVVAIGLDLGRALAAAHAAGVLHRDVKPANAFLCDDGTTKLLDFGLAKLSEASVTTEGTTEGAPDPRGGGLHAGETTPVVGTPLYMAPETWRAQAATRATDVYLLGGLLFKLLAGRAPQDGVLLSALPSAVLAGRIPDLAKLAPGTPAALVELVRRCLSLDPDDRPSTEAVCQALQALATPAEAPGTVDEDRTANPYRGLLSFAAEHRRLFFGREAETAAVLTALSAAPFVLVLGQSGSGKSSLVRAGVVPRVLAGALGSGEWHAATMLPGSRPIEHLAQALAPFLGEEAEGVALSRLRASPSWGAERIAERAGRRRLLLVVDQLEEAWTLSPPEDRSTFVEALSALARVGREVLMVATLRLDFLERLEDLGELRGLALRAPVVLGPLSSEGLRQAIEEPARLRGVAIDPALTSALIEKAQGEVGMLPLLEFALGVLWERRGPGATGISLADLAALGGLEGALAAHADGALARLGPRVTAEARRILLSLVTVERTRARRGEADLAGTSAEARAALGALLDARLVVATAGDGATAYELPHEVLVSGWPALRGWLDEASATRQGLERLRRAVAEWERSGRAREALWSERQLRELDVLGGLELTGGDAGRFVAESRAAARRARARQWALRLGAPLAALLVGAGLAGAVRGLEQSEIRAFAAAEIAAADAVERDVQDLSAELAAARAAAFARYDAGDWEGGEARWQEVLRLSRRASDAFAEASTHLGRALGRDPRDARTRAQAADLTYLWLLAAERDHDADLARDLGARLAALDDDGSRRARLAAPARLSVTVDADAPADTAVVLHAVRVDAGGHRVEDAGRPIALGASMELPPGSYVLAATAPGRYPTRLPLLLGRGDAQAIEIPLPAAADVPSGFVFVPAGDSIVGASDGEGTRLALNTEPEHPAAVEAFLIAQREVTFGEYLEFLAEIPAAEREVRTPRADGLGVTWDAEGVPTLTFGGLRARRGEPLCRPWRRAQYCQEWLRLPLFGVSLANAQAYAEWLARGRIPGVRFCTEREWERAARGADGRLYVDGDAPPRAVEVDSADRVGVEEVGSSPEDRSPFGVLDLGGSVREWVQGDTVRGATWAYVSVQARTASRGRVVGNNPGDVGIRVCAPAPGPAGTRPR